MVLGRGCMGQRGWRRRVGRRPSWRSWCVDRPGAAFVVCLLLNDAQALLQSNQQGAAVRNELVRVQQVAPLRYRAILALRWEAQLAAEKANAVMDLQCSLAETKAGLIRAEQVRFRPLARLAVG